MEEKHGFKKFTISEFENWIWNFKIARTVLNIQQHHTWMPSYAQFKGNNHFELQRGMRNHHVHNNGWSDIGQHLTIFPDGVIMTGRSFEKSPACIFGQNSNAFCIENLGNFDQGKDQMTEAQQLSIVKVTAILCKKFGLNIDVNIIVYHHWFNLSTGARNNGNGNNKSCPGTSFFGGNKVGTCEEQFLPLVTEQFEALSNLLLTSGIIKFVCVSAQWLNVRKKPHYKEPIARGALSRGVVLRVFDISDNGWLKISSKEPHWISAKFTYQVWKATVKSDSTISRSGQGSSFDHISVYNKGEVIFISEKANDWCLINMTMEWIHKDDLEFFQH